VLDINEVGRLIGGDRKPVNKVTIWRWVRAGTFPEPVRVSASTVRWHEADVDKWLASRPRGLTRMPEARKSKIAAAKAERRSRRGEAGVE
jgi:prophage regulatory protein